MLSIFRVRFVRLGRTWLNAPKVDQPIRDVKSTLPYTMLAYPSIDEKKGAVSSVNSNGEYLAQVLC